MTLFDDIRILCASGFFDLLAFVARVATTEGFNSMGSSSVGSLITSQRREDRCLCNCTGIMQRRRDEWTRLSRGFRLFSFSNCSGEGSSVRRETSVRMKEWLHFTSDNGPLVLNVEEFTLNFLEFTIIDC